MLWKIKKGSLRIYVNDIAFLRFILLIDFTEGIDYIKPQLTETEKRVISEKFKEQNLEFSDFELYSFLNTSTFWNNLLSNTVIKSIAYNVLTRNYSLFKNINYYGFEIKCVVTKEGYGESVYDFSNMKPETLGIIFRVDTYLSEPPIVESYSRSRVLGPERPPVIRGPNTGILIKKTENPDSLPFSDYT